MTTNFIVKEIQIIIFNMSDELNFDMDIGL